MWALFFGLFSAFLGISALGEERKHSPDQEPPEEDIIVAPKDYVLNPIQAEKELLIGTYYFKRGNSKAALRRFEEALKWNPSSAEAYLRIGETYAKLKDTKAARSAWQKYLELEPDGKQAAEIKRKLTARS